jgi:DNA (cytosine-5)-methyltransferase 1
VHLLVDGVDGDQYRPLTVRETARAMGFPDSYALPDINRRDAVMLCGNAACPPVARDLVSAVMEAA